MATAAILSFSAARAPVVSFAAASQGQRKPEAALRSGNWWSPIFGWPSEPDYLTSSQKRESAVEESVSPDLDRPEKNFFTGCFTEEKAKELRKRTIEISNFHDRMYHSAIAARLASDVSAAGRDR